MSHPLVPPIVPSAVFAFQDLDELDAAYGGTASPFIYARDGHPNAVELTTQLNKLHDASWGAVTGSGMGALAAAMSPLLAKGAKVLASDQLYGKTNKLLAEYERFGVTVSFVDVCDLGKLEHAIHTFSPTLVVVETISNPNCRVADLKAVVKLSQSVGAKVLVDNTFASPSVCKPLAWGADIVMESLTKILSGHSDVTLGYVGGKDLALGKTVTAGVSTWGWHASAFDCWLTARGLETASLRIPAAINNAAKASQLLTEHSAVARVIYPGLKGHPDYDTALSLFGTVAPGHMLCFELKGGRIAVNAFLRAASPELPLSPSLGHTRSTCSHPDSASHRFESAANKERLKITPGLVRLSVGAEPWSELEQALRKGLSAV